MTDATATSAPEAPDSHSHVSLEDFVAGRLTLQMLHNQLETQIATLRAQLTVADAQLRQTDELLRLANEKMAAQLPEAFAQLAGSDAGAVARAPKRSRS
jgi:hypothetical protein